MNKIIPMGIMVLVKPDMVEEVSAGGIILAPKEVKKDQYAQEKGTFVAKGSIAFLQAPAWGVEPQPGDKVLYKKYGGVEVKHGDMTYRLMEDECIGAVIEE